MIDDDEVRTARLCSTARVIACWFAALMLPPFIVLAVAPLLLLLTPVAMVGIPFLIPALLRGSIAAALEDRRRIRVRPRAQLRLIHP